MTFEDKVGELLGSASAPPPSPATGLQSLLAGTLNRPVDGVKARGSEASVNPTRDGATLTVWPNQGDGAAIQMRVVIDASNSAAPVLMSEDLSSYLHPKSILGSATTEEQVLNHILQWLEHHLR